MKHEVPRRWLPSGGESLETRLKTSLTTPSFIFCTLGAGHNPRREAPVLNNQHLGMVAQWEDRFYKANRAHTHLGDLDAEAEIYPDFRKFADACKDCYPVFQEHREDKSRQGGRKYIFVPMLGAHCGGDVCRKNNRFSWLPMYDEAKLRFIVSLWGQTTFIKPFVTSYEPEIDRKLGELKGQAKDLTYLLWQRVSLFSQSKFFEFLHCFGLSSETLQAYRRHFPQLQPTSFQSPGNVDPTYCSQVVIREGSKETETSLTRDSGKHGQQQRSSLTSHRIDREPTSPSNLHPRPLTTEKAKAKAK
ncbi:hypothetical protein SELMODRAFT_409729 [Selaginella moellendorffii]|uniref:Uncharacterized protein n=1 Tax=Selaginella moellendorffii TaxID=88036 RepID=D8RC94_SELML|nr:hypothetical protein SELMODRAFT_409729 [Selaginella moellendorffii]